MRLGPMAAHSDTPPTLPRHARGDPQKYTVPVSALVCRISATDVQPAWPCSIFPCPSARQNLAGERVPPRI